MTTLSAAILRRLDERYAAPFLFWNEAVLSCAEVRDWSVRLASGLAGRGVGPGDRVAVGLANSPELVATVLAVLCRGAILVPLNPTSSTEEAAYILDDSSAKLLVTHSDQAAALARRRGVDFVTDLADLVATGPPTTSDDGAPEDIALHVYTSGTTSRPKGVLLSHRALLSNLDTVNSAWRWTAEDRLLLSLPCFHLHGLALGLLGSLLVGSSVVLRTRFVAEEIPDLLSRFRCTMFFGVPTMYNRLVALAEPQGGSDLTGLRLWVSGSAPLTVATFERFRQGFGAEILERFGMTEGGFMIGAPYEGPRRPGIVGRPFDGIELQLIDAEAADHGQWQPVGEAESGEIVVRGANLFSGYWRRPDETERAFLQGFFRTGDMAVREPDGMIRIVGRRSTDILKSRGFKISAVEIENCLQSHPDVAEAAVVGILDADLGEAVVAVVTAAPGSSIDDEELRRFARRHLASYKVPSRFVFMSEIPRTGPGKFKKRELIQRLTGR